MREDLQDQPGAVHDLGLQGVLEVFVLGVGELRVENVKMQFWKFRTEFRQFFNFPRSYVSRRVDVAELDLGLQNSLKSCGLRQSGKLLKADVAFPYHVFGGKETD